MVPIRIFCNTQSLKAKFVAKTILVPKLDIYIFFYVKSYTCLLHEGNTVISTLSSFLSVNFFIKNLNLNTRLKRNKRLDTLVYTTFWNINSFLNSQDQILTYNQNPLHNRKVSNIRMETCHNQNNSQFDSKPKHHRNLKTYWIHPLIIIKASFVADTVQRKWK